MGLLINIKVYWFMKHEKKNVSRCWKCGWEESHEFASSFIPIKSYGFIEFLFNNNLIFPSQVNDIISQLL